ncbi:hypothetical protein A7U60_g696 [Sanghuangporus baumii]|uniref:BZIP domain-containing protein n=1 Tax=Sanghuangporus baumii TaxID=108892 RepID=A0A9Q5I554_SANBA|nr:hypothetical protein A7U60_g696 [Sanghuangporus baumii]
MELQTSRAHFTLDSAAASVLSAWENSQRHHPSPIHRPPAQYNNNNSFPISPVSPYSSPQSSRSSMLSNHWSSSSPTSVTEFEMLQLRRSMMPATAAAPIAERDPVLSATNYNFDFSLPHLPHLTLQPPPSPALFLQTHQQQRCSPSLPTPTSPTPSSVLFSSPPVSPVNNMNYRRESPVSTSSSTGTKRPSDETSASSSATSAKKPRAYVSLKDFVPPDVTGLSKREARLVKNRAAAFLSRQRKREEFELMEIRVAELERENARLREMADGASPAPTISTDSSELELLRMQLAASRQRESELVHRLEVLKHEQQKIKTEANEPSLSDGISSGANSPVMAPVLPLKNIVSNPKTGASLGLMVLLCALPSLLSHPSQSRSTLPTSQSFLDIIQWDAPSFFQTSASTSASIDELPSWELDFPGTSMDMDVDYGDLHKTEEEEPEWKKLELGLEGDDDLAGLGLGALDISFATRRMKDGKIRVRVHSSPSTSSSTSSESVPQLKTEDSSPDLETLTDQTLMPFSLPSPAQSQSYSPSASSLDENGIVNPLSLSFVDSDPLGPFLGAGSSPTGAFELGTPFDFAGTGSDSGLSGTQSGERRRVRIALRSLPQSGGEGGEWEVEVR